MCVLHRYIFEYVNAPVAYLIAHPIAWLTCFGYLVGFLIPFGRVHTLLSVHAPATAVWLCFRNLLPSTRLQLCSSPPTQWRRGRLRFTWRWRPDSVLYLKLTEGVFRVQLLPFAVPVVWFVTALAECFRNCLGVLWRRSVGPFGRKTSQRIWPLQVSTRGFRDGCQSGKFSAGTEDTFCRKIRARSARGLRGAPDVPAVGAHGGQRPPGVRPLVQLRPPLRRRLPGVRQDPRRARPHGGEGARTGGLGGRGR